MEKKTKKMFVTAETGEKMELFYEEPEAKQKLMFRTKSGNVFQVITIKQLSNSE